MTKQKGRPLKDASRGTKKPFALMLHLDDAAMLSSLGNGNKSEGIKIVLDFYKNNS